MPTPFSTNAYVAQNESRANPARFLDPNIASGELEFTRVPYTLVNGDLPAAGGIINLCLLPAGAIPVPQLSSVTCSADPGTTLTLNIGAGAVPAGWASGIVLDNGGQVACVGTTVPAWAATDTPITADAGSGNALIYATVATASTLTQGVTLMFMLAFKRGR